MPSQLVSSPHARGYFLDPRPHPPAPGLFPARAGVFPTTTRTRRASPPLPRTRGGISIYPIPVRKAGSSSPHARGYFREARRGAGLARLFPARAGVFPITVTGPGTDLTLPRTRGGISTVGLEDAVPLLSSPHARGYFRPRRGSCSARGLFPARAGVFPFRTARWGTHRTLPRTRGGISMRFAQSSRYFFSSPHARGYFRQDRGQPEHQQLFPARAGVFPARRSRPARWRSLPRTRGGISMVVRETGKRYDSSPHARGYFRARRARWLPGRLFPARAGVFPRRGRTHPGAAPLPRTRGGISDVGGVVKVVQDSSPHAWGYFHPPRTQLPRDQLFPARAGVFPPRGTGPPCPSPLPRPRGGISDDRPDGRCGGSSSPHARGYFQEDRQAVQALGLFPARAGVFPRSPSGHCEVSTLPRTRGGISGSRGCPGRGRRSSPHARGYFRPGPGRLRPRPLFPARAGVFPVGNALVNRYEPLPRTRGGISSPAEFLAPSAHASFDALQLLFRDPVRDYFAKSDLVDILETRRKDAGPDPDPGLGRPAADARR
jgi:hypothetical protein